MKTEKFLKYFEGKDLSSLTKEDLAQINQKINEEEITPLLKEKDKKMDELKVEQSKKSLESESLNKKYEELSNKFKEMEEKTIVLNKINKIKNINNKLTDDKVGGVILLADHLTQSNPDISYDQAIDKVMTDYNLKPNSTFKGSSLYQSPTGQFDSSKYFEAVGLKTKPEKK